MKTRFEIFIYMLVLILLININPTSALQVEVAENLLIEKSQMIVHGKVLNKVSYWNGGQTLIFTDYKIEVMNVLKGDTSHAFITVKVLGGEVGEIGFAVSHEPRIDIGEEVLLFLNEIEGSKMQVVYNSQGKKTVINGIISETGESIRSLKTRLCISNH
jgi:hypothetical protein